MPIPVAKKGGALENEPMQTEAEIVAWLKRFRITPVPRNAFHVRFGLHAGYPPCCVLFFMTTWGGRRPSWQVSDHSFSLVRDAEDDLFEVQYVPCPKCLVERAFVKKTKKCRCKKCRGGVPKFEGYMVRSDYI